MWLNGVLTDADDTAFDAWVTNIRRAEAKKLRRHAPAVVELFVVSAGGGVMGATDKLFPAPTGRIGYQRLALSGMLLTYQHLAAEFASHSCAYRYTAVIAE